MITETANPSEQVETAPVVPGVPTRSWTWATAVCTVAIFLGASLLFIAEMMVGKMVLPLLGGTPAVWNTCLMFFQAALLAGYGYAHWASRRLDMRRLTRVHVALLVLAAATLPVAIGPDRVPPSAAAPVWWLLGLLLTTIGAPFVLLAGTGPMLQRWFTASGHPRAHDPYFLFAASNLGSFAGLVGYPLFIEPAIGLSAQSLSWAAGYILLIGLVGGSALLLRPAGRPVAVDLPGDLRAPSRRDRIWWVALAFIPSSLLLGVTAHLSTDIAAFPLLWVVPLALYLLTFVVAFAATPFGGARSRRWLALTFLLVVLAQFVLMRAAPIVLLVLHLLPFTLAALGLHSELARRRPGGGRLTEYYLWIAFGGALGGVFNALVAPLVFDTVLEYPIMLVAAAALLSAPRADAPRARRPPPIALAFATVAGLALSWAIQQYVGGVSLQGTRAMIAYGATMVAVIGVLLLHRTGRSGLLMAGCLAAALWAARRVERSRGDVLVTVRDFFGVYKVGADSDGKYRIFQHGTTTHGVQATDSARRREPLSYYVRTGPLGDIFAGEAPPGRRVGVIGLGAGGMLAYAAPGDTWTYFEIAPAVERIARDTAFFTYLADAPRRTEVILGDARLSLARDRRQYDVLVLDAFSSDAIPVHLLTREAATLYAARLAPGGLLVLHISNRFFNLDPVVAGIADVTGMTARIRLDRTSALKSPREAATSRWAVLARHPGDLGTIGANPEWHPPDPSRTIVWTDDHSNVLSVFRWTRRTR